MNSEDADGIKDQHWAIVDSGSKVVTADGDEIGTVREKMPTYLTLRVKRDLLTEVEMYVPRDMIDRVEGDSVHLARSGAEIETMDLTKPPAMRSG